MDTHRQQQVVALGRLGWPLRRIERETGVLRETASEYLKAADVPVRGRGRPGEGRAKPAIAAEVSTDSCPRAWPPPSRAPQASACAPHRERVVAALALGRNAMAVWQDLVDQVKAAERLGISLNRLNEIVLGKRGITADTALRLSRLLKTSPQLWMRLQADWDLHQTLQRAGRKTSWLTRLVAVDPSFVAMPSSRCRYRTSNDARFRSIAPVKEYGDSQPPHSSSQTRGRHATSFS